MSRLKALYRSWGISCSGKQVYTPRHREQWLNKITQPGVCRRAELMYQQMDGLSVVRHTVRGELLAESRKHQAVRILRQVPLIGPLRAQRLNGAREAGLSHWARSHAIHPSEEPYA